MDKARRYKKVINELSHYFEGYNIGKIARMSMIASTLSNEFPDWIFCGFYRVKDRELLEIGPYQSSITPCGHIKFSKGVCGKSAREEKSIIVDNVNNFEDYISCDDQTISEIVVPVFSKNKLIAVLDIDGREEGQFDQTDKKYLKDIISYLK
tara:strand:+ start:266 stop:721 length:456 start_codon:yes stop_codon:yes gene_type:complete